MNWADFSVVNTAGGHRPFSRPSAYFLVFDGLPKPRSSLFFPSTRLAPLHAPVNSKTLIVWEIKSSAEMMRRNEFLCCFLLLQLLMAPMAMALPVDAADGHLAGTSGKEGTTAEEQRSVIIRKRATSNLLKGAAIGAVLGLAGAAAYNVYKNRKQQTPPPTQTEDEQTNSRDQ